MKPPKDSTLYSLSSLSSLSSHYSPSCNSSVGKVGYSGKSANSATGVAASPPEVASPVSSPAWGPRPASLPAHVRAGLVEALAELLVAEYTHAVAECRRSGREGGGGLESLGSPAAGPVATHARDFKALKPR